jgi:hypothetical protein
MKGGDLLRFFLRFIRYIATCRRQCSSLRAFLYTHTGLTLTGMFWLRNRAMHVLLSNRRAELV